MKNFIYTMISSCMIVSSIMAQDKPVYWLHGYQFGPIPTTDEFPGRWDLYATKFAQDREIESIVPNFARTRNEVEGGIVNAANVLASQVTDNDHSIVIGHSMGGMVARQMDLHNNKAIGGIVTIGTAHQGARIATNLQNGNVVKLANEGFTELARGPLSVVINITFPFTLGQMNAKSIANLLWDDVLESSIMDNLPPPNTATLQDLMPGSAVVRDLNSRHPKVPLINVVLSETDHEIFRLIGSREAQPELEPLHTHDDGQINAARIALESWYRSKKDYYRAIRWINLLMYASYTAIANDYAAGEAYLDHGMETDYNVLNGSSTYEYYTATRQVWRCDVLDGSRSSRVDLMALKPLPTLENCDDFDASMDCGDCRFYTETYTARKPVKYPQDGLVSIKAQETNVDVYRTMRVETVNHMEVGNHPRMTDLFRQIFEQNRTVFYRGFR